MIIDTSKMKGYFSLDSNIKRLEDATELKSPILDIVYPESKREQYPSAIVKKSDLPTAIKNAPVIERGDSAYEMPGKITSINGYEPYPIELSKRIPATELNNILSNIDGLATSTILDTIYERMRKTVRATTEALAAQSLSGTISYAIKERNDLYTVNFGTTKTKTCTKKFNEVDATLADALLLFYEMCDSISVNGYGQNIVILAGRKAFSALVMLLTKAQNVMGITVTNYSINFPGFSVIRLASTYYDYKTKKDKQIVDDDKLCAIAVDAPFWLPYCAIDDIEAGLASLPFFTSFEEIKNPSAIDIFGKSKPFPVPVVECICWSNSVLQ
ncbi:MAG: hypothetical protein HDR51_00340 [Treponema sp.]|nr:hypothetical protein [Treponema sp.]